MRLLEDDSEGLRYERSHLKKIEVVGSSTKSIEDAVNNAVARASMTIIVNIDMVCHDDDKRH